MVHERFERLDVAQHALEIAINVEREQLLSMRAGSPSTDTLRMIGAARLAGLENKFNEAVAERNRVGVKLRALQKLMQNVYVGVSDAEQVGGNATLTVFSIMLAKMLRETE